MTPHVDIRYIQGNILITRDGQACLADFGVASVFIGPAFHAHTVGSLRYVAPERFSEDSDSLPMINGPSKQSDIYSLAMTSFEVRFSVVNYPNI